MQHDQLASRSNLSGYNGTSRSADFPEQRAGSSDVDAISRRDFQSFVTDVERLIMTATSLLGADLAEVRKQMRERIESAKFLGGLSPEVKKDVWHADRKSDFDV